MKEQRSLKLKKRRRESQIIDQGAKVKDYTGLKIKLNKKQRRTNGYRQSINSRE